MEAYELGLGDPIAVSAEHNEGVAGLMEAIGQGDFAPLLGWLRAHLPEDFDACAGLLEASLKRVPSLHFEHDPDDELGTLQTDDSGVAGWARACGRGYRRDFGRGAAARR